MIRKFSRVFKKKKTEFCWLSSDLCDVAQARLVKHRICHVFVLHNDSVCAHFLRTHAHVSMLSVSCELSSFLSYKLYITYTLVTTEIRHTHARTKSAPQVFFSQGEGTHHGVERLLQLLLLLHEQTAGRTLPLAVAASGGEETRQQHQQVPQRDLHRSARPDGGGGAQLEEKCLK